MTLLRKRHLNLPAEHVLLNFLEVPPVVVCHKVDSHSLPAETAETAAALNPAQQQQHVSVKITVSLEE